jgi:hypothetical protein
MKKVDGRRVSKLDPLDFFPYWTQHTSLTRGSVTKIGVEGLIWIGSNPFSDLNMKSSSPQVCNELVNEQLVYLLYLGHMKVPTHEIDVIVPKFIGMDHDREKGKWKD